MKKLLMIALLVIALNIQLVAEASLENLSDQEILLGVLKANEQKDYQTKLNYYNEMLKRQPKNGSCYGTRGLIYLVQYDNYTQAISDFSSAINYGYDNSKMYTYRGFSRMKLGDIDGAISDLSKAILINSEKKTPDAFTYCTRALVYLIKQEYKLAIEDATMSIKLQPQNPNAFECRGTSKVGLALQTLSLETAQSGLVDINYAKEQFLKEGDIEGYQQAIKTFNVDQAALKVLEREKFKNKKSN